jgi:membrane-bound metal-dependent hydrolase YbcI (DUF457 family)
VKGGDVEIGNDNKEYRAGAFFGLVAMVLVLALTAMALSALAPVPDKTHAMNWGVSAPEPSAIVVPSFGS